MRYEVKVTIEGRHPSTVRKDVAKKLKMELEEVSVEAIKSPQSRADRLAAACELFEEAKSEVEALKDELEQWRDGMPENLQSGSKAEEIGQAIDELEQLHSDLDGISGFDSVSFPSMY